MSDTTVERMVRAMDAVEHDGVWQSYARKMALAALTALSKPTELVIDAAYRPGVFGETADIVWRAQIEAAIAEASPVLEEV